MAAQAAISDCAKLDQVHGPTQETFKRFLEASKVSETVREPWLEFYEHIDITALGIKVLAHDGTERLETPPGSIPHP